MIGIPLGLLYANASEWLIHKHLLHGRGKKKGSFWSFHWHEHHNESRKEDMIDSQYQRKLFRKWDPQTKEATMLLAAVAVHLPLTPVAPFFVGAVTYSALNYYRVHKKSHLDHEWGREHLAWHYDHHMGPNQDSNWCVTHPFTDWIMGTREEYAGSDKEKEDRERRARIRDRRAKAWAQRTGDAESSRPSEAVAA
jgi:hypothetical protein